MAATIEQYEPPFHRTFAWVTGGHVVLILLILIGVWLAPQQRENIKFINMVELGDLVQGTPDGSQIPEALPPAETAKPLPVQPPAKAIPDPTPMPVAKQAAPPPPPVQPKTAVVPLPQIKAEPQPIAKPEPKPKKAAPPKPKAAAKPKPKPSKPKVKVNLNQVTRQKAAPKPKPQRNKAAAVTPSDVLDKLNQAISKAGARNAAKSTVRSGLENGAKNKHGAYYRLIRDQMYEAWSSPAALIGEGLQTIIQIRLASDGRILDVQLVRSSGNDEHDRTSLAAARRVGRIRQPPPEGLDPWVEINFRMQR